MSGLSTLAPPNLTTNEQGDAAVDVRGDTATPSSSHDLSRAQVEKDAGGPDTLSQPPHSVFTHRQKLQITILVSLASVFSPMSATIYTPALPTIAQDLGVSVSLVNLSVTSYMIFQGLSPSIWGSVTDVLGRRPVYLLTFCVYIGACLGLAFTTNYTQLIVLRCLQSTGSASTIAIGAGVIGDITQRKERGGYIGFYSAGSLVGNALGPILGGIFAQTVGWHGIFYFLTALAGCFAVVLFLVLPETLRAIVGNGSIEPGSTYLTRPVLRLLSPPHAGPPTEENPRPPRRKVDIFGPLKMMRQLDVLCGLLFTAFFYTVWQATLVASATLFATVYGLDKISVGLAFIANGVGAVSASLVVGKILNHDYKIAQRREKAAQDDATLQTVETGARQVEHIEHARLRRSPYMAFIFIGACLAYGWCTEARTTVALPIFWTFFTGFTTTAIMSMFSTLIVDWYPDSGASATAAINLARCLLGAGGTAVIQPMINRIGVGWTFTVGAGIAVAALPLGVLVWYRGEQWRRHREDRLRLKQDI